jgi:hypothetical protein
MPILLNGQKGTEVARSRLLFALFRHSDPRGANRRSVLVRIGLHRSWCRAQSAGSVPVAPRAGRCADSSASGVERSHEPIPGSQVNHEGNGDDIGVLSRDG